MPFQSEKQRRFLHANHPEIAKRWERDYATGGISNHFRKRFFTGAQADTSGPAGGQAMSPGTSTTGGTRHGGGGGNGGTGGNGHHPPVYTGPTPAEIAAAKAKAEAEKRALEEAARKKYLADFKGTQKKKVKHKKEIEGMGFNEFQKFGKGLMDFAPEYYANLANQNKIKTGKLDFGEQEWQNLIVPGVLDLGKNKEIESMGFNEFINFGEGLINQPKDIEGYEAKLNLVEQTEYDQLKQKEDANKATDGMTPALNDKEKERKKELEKKEKESKLTTDSGTMIGAKGGVARKNYFHGGILDINESEEIIDDGGNEIELTDYNAAFDEPTGVKSLFQAKEGGRIGFYRGSDRHPGTSSSSTSYGPPGSASRASAPTHQPAPDRESTPPQVVRHHAVDTPTQIKEQKEIEAPEDLAQRAMDLRSATVIKVLRAKDLTKEEKNRQIKYQISEINKIRKLGSKVKDAFAVHPIVGVLVGIYEGSKIKKEQEAEIAKLEKQIGLLKDWDQGARHHSVETPLAVLEQRILDLTQPSTRDDGGPDGPEPIYAPVTGAVDEEYAQGYYGMSDLDRIRANQAKRAMLVEKGIIQDNPIVDESITDITMTANRGGLANLFRVKN